MAFALPAFEPEFSLLPSHNLENTLTNIYFFMKEIFKLREI
jgi:hypothetical protein